MKNFKTEKVCKELEKQIKEYEKRKQSGKEIFYQFETPDIMFDHMDGKPCKEVESGTDKYGNKIIKVSKI